MRSGSTQTTTGVTTRPITKLYPLEVNAEVIAKNRTDFNDNDSPYDTPLSPIEEPQISTRPQRRAVIKAKHQMSE